MKPETRLCSPFGTLELRRWPRRRDESLRAWDGADRYLLEHVAEHPVAGPVLVLNDTCGALALSLPRVVASGGDSWLAREALRRNAADNALAPPPWCWPGEPAPAAALVVARLPRELSLLEYQLASIAGLPAGTRVILGGLDRHLPVNLLDTLGRWLLNPHATRGRHKARLFVGQTGLEAVPPVSWPRTLAVQAPPLQLSVHAGVFAGDRLDIGARFFLEHLPAGVRGRVADLGCGNGVVGIAAALGSPEAEVWFCDQSAQAIRSARENAAAVLPGRSVGFHLGNGLDGLDGTFDLILLNPPFHRGHAVDDSTARMLFRHARRQLAPGGQLRVIGNRHLGYHLTLGRLFPEVTAVAANAKFVILDASDNNKTSPHEREHAQQ